MNIRRSLILSIFVIFILSACSTCYAASRIVLVDGDGNEISATNPLIVQGV